MSVQITHNEYIKLHAEKMVAEDKLKKETTDYTALIHKWNALVDKTRAERIAKNEEKAKMVRLQGKYDDLLKDYKLITARLD